MLRFCIKIYTHVNVYINIYVNWYINYTQLGVMNDDILNKCPYVKAGVCIKYQYIYIHTNIYTCIIYQISYRTNVIIYSYTTKRIFSWYLPSTFTSNRNKVTASGARPLQGQKWRKHGGSKAWQRHVRSCYIPLRWNNPRK